MKNSRSGFISSSLIKIKDKLPDGGERDASDLSVEAGAEPTPNSRRGDGEFYQREHRKALQKRVEEFRLLKKDLAGKITEKLASIPEDIRISETRISELRSAVEKYASILDTIQSLDEFSWHEDNLSLEVGRSMKKAENIRLEFIRISSKISSLQRESEAAENSAQASFMPEIRSLTFAQVLKFGFIISIPVILTLIAASFIISIFMYATFRM